MSDLALVSPPLPTSPCLTGEALKLGIMASGSGSNFEAVAAAIAAGQLNAQIQVLIYNNPQAKAAERAQNHGVPAVLLNHRDFDSREALDAQVAETLQAYGVEWVIMAGWMRIVTPTLIDAFPGRMINIHPSLLPSFKGIRAIEQALASQVKLTGCTVHIVTLEMDSGPILMQAAVPILEGDDAERLHQRIQVQEHRILPAAIALAAQRYG
ncbi:MAG: phosphoribosylglycinamide formyltransferase [Synechococcales cyanobacterium CRU_2_2]|nr:phosphoribosylglycinamide formyltransferase [Synechococcales cyanobacterium CRU_2_2]